jgi:hypothetical protein
VNNTNTVFTQMKAISFIRNDTLGKKVYLFYNGQDSLIYNFNLSIGDVINPTIHNTTCGLNMVIDTIGFVTINGKSYKYYGHDAIDSNYLTGSKFIEGFGSLNGFIAYNLSNVCFESSIETLCIKQGNTWIYGDSSVPCYHYPLGISAHKLSNTLSISPNPSSNYLTISGIQKPSSIKIYTIEGALIKSIVNFKENQNIDVSGYRDGLYILQITNLDGKSSRKFEVMH